MKLSEVCLNIVDCPHSTAPDEGSGYALVRTPNIGKGRFNLEGVHRISEAAYKKRCARITPTVNDLILAREAPAGNVAIIKENMEPLALGQRTVLIRPNPEKVCPDFLVYYLLAPQQQNELLGRATGATVAHVNIPIINNLPVSLPPLETQQKIAGILSAYDDLTENNRNQIKLLEEAAQKLYKEWFVKLNFPGHENVKIVDGLPEGWEKERLEDWCRVFTGKKNANQNVEKGLYPFFTCAPEPLLSNDSLYEGKAVIISGNGSYTGRTQYYDGNFDLYQRTYACVKQKQEDYEYMPFIYYTMKILFEPIKMGGTKGAAIPYIVMSDITDTEFLYQYDICKKFSNFAEYVLDKIQTLQNTIKLSKQARDKLLPRLMNGELL